MPSHFLLYNAKPSTSSFLSPNPSQCALSLIFFSAREKLTFLFYAIGAINSDTYEKMNTNEIYKYMKTLARIHPKHRSRYSHTAYIHSTSPDPVQNRMIDRCVAITFKTGMNITKLVYLQDKETDCATYIMLHSSLL